MSAVQIEIASVARTKTQEHWELGLLDLATMASREVLEKHTSRFGTSPTAVVTANALGATMGDQRNLATYLAGALGLSPVEAISVEGDEAAGGAAVRTAVALVRANLHHTVLVTGAEKTSDALPDQLESCRASGLKAAREAGFGFGPTIAGALGMGRYLAQYQLPRDLFYHLARTAHAHGQNNSLAFFPWPLKEAQYQRAPMVATPLTVCDNAPMGDGAAALIIRRVEDVATGPIIVGSASVSTTPGIEQTIGDLSLPAATASAKAAQKEAGISTNDIDLFELHDANAFLAALSIEAVGLARPGGALHLAANDELLISGKHPCWVYGGQKSRGNVSGANGVFSTVEAALALGLDKEPPQNRFDTAMVQSLGSFGALAITHLLRRS